jgi:hypothetical protein
MERGRVAGLGDVLIKEVAQTSDCQLLFGLCPSDAYQVSMYIGSCTSFMVMS